MSTILVTGVAGFIGSNLAAALIARGDEVKGLDNLSQGSRRNLAGLLTHPRFEFHEDDVRDEARVAELVGSVDCVVHLAAYKIPRYGNALATLQINWLGAQNVLCSAARERRRVVLASTSDVYGRNPELPFTESSDLWMGPSNVRRWSYAVSKMFDEHLAFAYRESAGLPVTVVRFFGGYGPHQSTSWWGGPQAVFIEAALDNLPMEIHGDGLQTRSFTYVDDHVEGLLRCIDTSAAVGEVFNLGTTDEITIRSLAELVWELAGRGEPLFSMKSYRSFGKYQDVRRRVPDNSKAARLLDFSPRFGLRDGLEKTIAWQRSLRDSR